MAHILIADDEEIFRDFLKEVVERLGHTAVTAKDGKEAMKQFRSLPIALSIVDIRMPGKNGLEFLAEAKKINPSAVVVMMTGYPSAETIVETIEKNGYTYLSKPLKIEVLTDLIHRGLEQYHASRMLKTE